MKSLFSIIILSLFLLSCGGKKSKETGVSLSLKGFLGSAAFPGGVMVYGRDFERGLFFSRYVSGDNDNVVLSNGNWHFAAVAYAGPGPLEGQVKCDATDGISLNGGEAVVNFALSTTECAKDHFGPNNYTYADGQFYDLRFVTCARPDQVEKGTNINCQLGRANSYKITFLEASVGPSLNPILFGGITSNCIGDHTANQAYFDPGSFYKIPVGSDLIPVPIVITAFDGNGCTGDQENFVFGSGLQFGEDGGFTRGNVNDLGQKAAVFLRSDMCQGDGLTNTPFAQGAVVNSPNNNFICNEAQLQQVAPAVAAGANRIFSLEEDIFLSTDWQPFMIGTSGTPFLGQFHGHEHVIYDLAITSPTSSGVGFFGYVGNGAKISDLSFDGVDIDGNGYSDIGTLIGSGTGFELKNIHVYDDPLETANDISSVSGSNAGGLIGFISNANDFTIENVSVTGMEISAMTNIGGAIGNANTPAASASLFFDLIADEVELQGDSYIGGMIGKSILNAGTISADWDVINTDIEVQVSGATRVGGLIGDQLASAGSGLFVGMRAGGSIALPAGNGYQYIGGSFGSAAGVQGAGFSSKVEVDGSLISGGTNQYFGGFAGYSAQAFQVQNVNVDVTTAPIGCFDCTYVGGFLGGTGAINASSGFIGDSSSNMDVEGGSYAGGFIGQNTDVDLVIVRAYATGDVTAPATATDIGGFIGEIVLASIDEAFATGDVTTGATSDRTGGFVGYSNAATIRQAYSYGDADGTQGANRGAFGGFINGGTVANIYFNNTVNTITDGSATGLTQADMTTTGTLSTNFSGYDFTATGPWVDSGVNGLPQLKFENFYNELGGFVTGSFFDPVPICTPAEWNKIGDNDFLKFANIILTCNLDFAYGTFNPIGSASTPFEGNLLGNNATISRISEDDASRDNFGLIAVADGAKVAHDDGYGGYYNLYLDDVQIRGRDNVGLVIGGIDDQTGEDNYIVNVVIDGNSKAEGRDHVGGVVGYVSASATGTLAGVFSSASVDANNSPTTTGGTGGLVGTIDSASFGVANSIVTPNGTANQINGLDRVGGVVGKSSSASGSSGGIVEVVNFGAEVTGAGQHNGGLVGYLTGSIERSFASTDVNAGSNNTGGLVGSMFGSASVDDSYCSYCNITGAGTMAGLVGNVSTGSINTSYTTQISLSVGTEGIANGSPTGLNNFTDSATCASFGGCTKTTAQMMDIATFGSFDFSIWEMEDGHDTPKLRWAAP